jgi:hypothetical protein
MITSGWNEPRRVELGEDEAQDFDGVSLAPAAVKSTMSANMTDISLYSFAMIRSPFFKRIAMGWGRMLPTIVRPDHTLRSGGFRPSSRDTEGAA